MVRPQADSSGRDAGRRTFVTSLLGAAALLAAALAAAGCGGISQAEDQAAGNQLTVYSSLPLQGPEGPMSAEIVNGERMALAESGGRVGAFRVSFASLDDSSPATGEWDPGLTATAAKTAAQDRSTIAYLGDLDSGATAISLPLVNAADILQISPDSPYVGLTSAQDAGQDEPNRFYPTGMRTFGRLVPSDAVQGQAVVSAMLRRHVRSVYVLGEQNPLSSSLSAIVARDAASARIALAGNDRIDATAGDFTGETRKVAASGADAVFYGGGATVGTARLWRALYAADPGLTLFASSTAVDPAFAAALGSAARATLITTPFLPVRLYPAAAQRFLRRYRAQFGYPGSAYALYGYEAMRLALLAVRAAGPHGNSRQAVVRAFFSVRDRDSVLGRYSILPSGETTLTEFGLDRVSGGRPVFAGLAG